MADETRVYGPPGTGKTSKLANEIIPDLAMKYGKDKIMITSFTKAAAKELGSRLDVDNDDITGTLHSICYRALQKPSLTEEHLTEWDQLHPNYALKLDSVLGSECYNEYQILRNKLIPRDSWTGQVLGFATRWEEWKKKKKYMDFMDLIEEAGNFYVPPGSPDAIVIDEAQDFTKLEMSVLRRWSSNVQEFWVVGDDDQCSPGETLISTINGNKRLDELNRQEDKLIAYDKRSSCLNSNRGNGYNFDINSRIYSGPMYTFIAGDKRTKCTPNHLWNVKWNDRSTRWTVVYLMRKGSMFRIGWAQLFKDEKSTSRPNSFHLSTRLKLEKADSLWVLKVFIDKKWASAYESYVAAEYGLPLNMFEPYSLNKGRSLYTKETISWIFNTLTDQKDKVLKLLSDHNLDIKYPFYTKEKAIDRSLGSRVFKLEAINIASLSTDCSFFKIPVRHGQKMSEVSWQPVSVLKKNIVKEKVYSLDVEKYHTYVSDDLCTCNCIYTFAGSSPENMLFPEVPEKQKIILSQSWRIPKAVHMIAEKIIKQVTVREPKTYKPKENEGKVIYGDGTFNLVDWAVNLALKGKGSSMFIASCNYMLFELIKDLRAKGIPFSNPWRAEEKSWNPLQTNAAEMLVCFLSSGSDEPYWDVRQFVEFAQHLRVGPTGLIRKQGKAGIKQLQTILEESPGTPGLHTSREFLSQILSEDAIELALARDLDWLSSTIVKAKQQALKYPIKIYKRHGRKALLNKPNLFIGTIHSVKGAEADTVFLYPDISFTSAREMESREGFENLCRLFYVGATRAKEQLVIMQPASKNYFQI